MNTIRIEVVPTEWTEAREGAFFRLVADVLPRGLLDAATVLLASYDPELSEDSRTTGEGRSAAELTGAPTLSRT